MKTQNPTTAATQFKAELWTTVSSPNGTQEVWATVMLNGPDKDMPCGFRPKEQMEDYVKKLNEFEGVLA
jgi:hypothetical protein